MVAVVCLSCFVAAVAFFVVLLLMCSCVLAVPRCFAMCFPVVCSCVLCFLFKKVLCALLCY